MKLEEMPPLPKEFGWVHDANGNQPLSFDKELKPLAAFVCSTLPVFSADQMHSYAMYCAALVREECARLAEDMDYSPDGAIAFAIRNRMHCVRCGDTGFAEEAPDKPLVKCPDCSTPSSAIRNKE